ncbi:MAG: alanine--glyoxylate aminotransferase family protein [FCB group bacterium]|nr:alanine--glyoxylate aminotransferase family protein [FCB group bacterium]
MSSFLFSPGPTHIPPEISKELAGEPAHHRSQAFSELFRGCLDKLKLLFKTGGEVAVLTCSGSGAMEAAVLNTVETGSEILIVEGGKFGRRWIDICGKIGCGPHVLSFPAGQIIDPEETKTALRKHPKTKAVFLTQTESSTGQLADIKGIARVIKTNSSATIIADVFGSLGSDPFHQQDWDIDVAVCGSQKGLMCPPGLGFVSVSAGAREKLVDCGSLYWDLQQYFKYHAKGFTPFTPAINLIAGIDKALDMIFEDGLEKRWFEKSCIAQAFRETVRSAGLKVFPANPSAALTVFCLPDQIKDTEVILKLEEKTGFRVSGGQSELAGSVIRAAHMGAISYQDTQQLIEPLFSVLDSLGFPNDAAEVLHTFNNIYKLLKPSSMA